MTKLTTALASTSSPWFSLEFFPPKTSSGFDNLCPRLARLSRLQPLFVTVTWGAGGSTAAKSLDLAQLCQERYALTTCLHLTCTNMRQRVLDDALARCKEIGVRNILALRGDEPREEYGDPPAEGEEVFEYAVDLVRYIRRKHGDYFCVGVAGYPEGHATSQWSLHQSPQKDLPYLREKIRAGADFVMTQLFYDVDAFLGWRDMLRRDESGLFQDVPIIPGLMPVQSWGILARTTKLSCAKVPPDMMGRFEKVKGDDEMVKRQGVAEVRRIVKRIRDMRDSRQKSQGFHFYTLNLEKAVAQILEECGLVPQNPDNDVDGVREEGPAAARRRRLSSKNSGPRNRVVVDKPPNSGAHEAVFEAADDEAGVPDERPQSRANALATAEGQGSLGREATWDDYPNGRFGDARSPAYGTIDGYGPSLHVTPRTALSIWGAPTTRADITLLFHRHLTGALSTLPWSEPSSSSDADASSALSPETALILHHLLAMTARGWWSLASQPAVDAAPSSDLVVGWGPKTGGWVWQRPFVEFFLPAHDWRALQPRLDARTPGRNSPSPSSSESNGKDDDADGVIYFAANAAGDFRSNAPDSVNPVTWGAFRGKEIVTPTIIEAVSFRAWREEAFALWECWARVYPRGSEAARGIRAVSGDLWLVNCIGMGVRGGELWGVLLGC